MLAELMGCTRMRNTPLLRCAKSWLAPRTCQPSSQTSSVSQHSWQQHWRRNRPAVTSSEPLTLSSCTRHTHTTSHKCRALVHVGEFRQHWIETLTKCGVPEPYHSVKYILEHVLCVHNNHSMALETSCGTGGKAQTQQTDLSDSELQMATQMLTQRLQRAPVQYIIGEWDFRNVTLEMRPPVLIPRPETEELVGLVLEYSCTNRSGENGVWRFLDVGCGSGAIAIALLQEGKVEMEGYAVDTSEEAVALTTENALRNGVHSRLSVAHCSAENCPSVFGGNRWQFDSIIANPPYIPSNEMRSLQPEILWYEDHRALDGGDSGLNVITDILEMSRHVLKRNGHVWLETGLCQDIHSLLIQHHQWELYHKCTYKDYTQRDRFHQLIRT